MRLLYLALLLQTSCGTAADYQVYAIDVHTNSQGLPTRAQLREHLDYFIYFLSLEMGKSRRWIRDRIKGLTALHFLDEPWDPEIIDGQLYVTLGEYDIGSATIYVWLPEDECLGRTALTHELLHHMVWFLWEKVDLDHNAYRWQPGGLCEILETNIEVATCMPKEITE